ncbi:MAG: hypothetical protein ISR69_09825 [Gammaproteobacteria bacterium]|nr:hypothetical protein [Gammaproteobacteria bacterium]
MLRVFKVEGHSLFPLLREGQRILCIKSFSFVPIKKGDFVIFKKSPYGLMIKQVDSIKNNKYFVVGTDPMSIDSRDFGAIPKRDILYKKINFF